MEETFVYTLNDKDTFTTFGTSFKNAAEAKNYAIDLQEYGKEFGISLCKRYRIGRFSQTTPFEVVYDSD